MARAIIGLVSLAPEDTTATVIEANDLPALLMRVKGQIVNVLTLMIRVLVTGGTGVLGREVAAHLLEKGYTVRILSRSPQRGTANVEWAQAHILTGEGLSEALQGVDVIVHAATDHNFGKTDVAMTRRLLEKAKAAGIGYFLYISIVGIDKHPSPSIKSNSTARHWCMTAVCPTPSSVSPNSTN